MDQPSKRLILLGASNLTRAVSVVIETARTVFGSPLEVYAALGHGRSYGMRSSILFGARALPGIVECGLWKAFSSPLPLGEGPGVRAEITAGDAVRTLTPTLSQREREQPPTFALLTDIGNDIMYGAPPLQIASWVEQCVERLQHHNASIAMTTLPIENIRAVKRWQYAIVKAMLFPTRQLTFVDAIDRANELHDLLIDLAQRRNVQTIEPLSLWYGFDPIHIRWRHWPSAWAQILGACAMKPDQPGCRRPAFAHWLRIRSMMPEEYWLAGMPLGRQQPAGTLPDGTSISLY